jgi:hypothetical protein
MKRTDKLILGGAFLTGIVGVLAYKGVLHWPKGPTAKGPTASKGSAPVHPSQTKTTPQAEVPAYGQAGYVPQTATDAQGSYDPNAPAAPPAGGSGSAVVDPSQVYAVGEGGTGAGYTASVGD